MQKQGSERKPSGIFSESAKNTVGLVVSVGIFFPMAIGGAMARMAVETGSDWAKQIGKDLTGMVRKRR